jgi:hypothetical protein
MQTPFSCRMKIFAKLKIKRVIMKHIIKNKRIGFLYLGVILISIISGGVIIQSCTQADDIYLEENNKDKIPDALINYFNSNDYFVLSRNFKIGLANIDFDNLVAENFNDATVNVYYLPVKKGQNTIGQLCIISKDEEKIYKSLYEDRSELQKADEGKIAIYTSQGLFVADFNYKKESNGLYLLRLSDVGNSNSTPRLKSGVEWPNPSDGWWSCTTNCYSYAKQACSSTSQCDFLCDIANLIGGCTISMAVACSAYCL